MWQLEGGVDTGGDEVQWEQKEGDHQLTDKLEFMEAASEEDTDEEIYEMEN
jgi:hypothetical protein